jgi:excisionase family DNA binding protein
MREVFAFPEMSGYVSVKQAAKMLGVSERRVHQYIEAGRLQAYKPGRDILLPVEVVEQFKSNLVGRPRKKTSGWRGSSDNASLLITHIRVQVRTGKQTKFIERLHTIKREERHLFPGTVTRYISQDDTAPATVTIQLVWKSSEMPDETARQEALADFQEELADVLDWDTAQFRTEKVLIHT